MPGALRASEIGQAPGQEGSNRCTVRGNGRPVAAAEDRAVVSDRIGAGRHRDRRHEGLQQRISVPRINRPRTGKIPPGERCLRLHGGGEITRSGAGAGACRRRLAGRCLVVEIVGECRGATTWGRFVYAYKSTKGSSSCDAARRITCTDVRRSNVTVVETNQATDIFYRTRHCTCCITIADRAGNRGGNRVVLVESDQAADITSASHVARGKAVANRAPHGKANQTANIIRCRVSVYGSGGVTSGDGAVVASDQPADITAADTSAR